MSVRACLYHNITQTTSYKLSKVLDNKKGHFNVNFYQKFVVLVIIQQISTVY